MIHKTLVQHAYTPSQLPTHPPQVKSYFSAFSVEGSHVTFYEYIVTRMGKQRLVSTQMKSNNNAVLIL